MLNIDEYAHFSKLKQNNPLERLTFALVTMVSCLWADSLHVSISVLSLMGWVAIWKGGVSLSVFIKLLLIPFSFLFFTGLAVYLVFSGDPQELIFAIPVFQKYLGISKSGLTSAAGLVCKGLAASSCLFFLALTTPLIDLLAAFKRLKFPKLLMELMGLIYHFIFLLIDMSITIFNAQSSRLGYSCIASGYRSLGALAASLFVKAYKRADEVYTALEARCYQGDLNVLQEPYEKHRSWYFATIIINIFLIVVTLINRWYIGG